MSRPRIWPPRAYPHPASGQERLTVRVDGVRRDFVLGPIGSLEARAEYLRVVRQIERAGFRLDAGAPEEATVEQLVLRYTRHVESYYRPESKELGLVRRALQYVLARAGEAPAREFGPLALKGVLADMEASGKARTYCNRMLGRIKRAFRWGVGEELFPEEVYRRLTAVDGLARGHTVAPENSKILPVDSAVVAATLPHLTPVLQALVQFQLLTGCRPKEACWLRPCDLDRAWKVVDGIPVWLYRLDEHKTGWRGAPCLIPVGPRAQAVLAPYLDRDPSAYCFSPLESRAWWLAHKRRKRKSKVQPSQRDRRSRHPARFPGTRYTTESYAHAVARVCERHGIPAWSPNQLRKRAGTDVQNAHDRDHARCVLRHQSPDVSARYILDAEKAAAVIARMG